MGTAIPYSDIDTYLSKTDLSNGCLLDTNFLIALTEENHKHNDDSRFIYEKLVEYKVPIYCTVTVRTEFIDYQRRIKMTESLMDMLAQSSKWKISSSVRDTLKKHRGWIDNQAKDEEIPCLSDTKIKEIKKIFLPKTQSGQIGWVELCKEFLSGRLLLAWNDIQDALSLNYIHMRDSQAQYLFQKNLYGKTCTLYLKKLV